MLRNFINAMLCILAAMALGACGEKAPREDPERIRSYNEAPQNPLHDRAQTQNESERIGN